MTEQYRVITPEMILVNNDFGHDHTSSRLIKTVLWQGDGYPSDATLRVLSEGQTDVRRRQRESNYSENFHNVGNLLYVQKRRKAKLGWHVVSSLELPYR